MIPVEVVELDRNVRDLIQMVDRLPKAPLRPRNACLPMQEPADVLEYAVEPGVRPELVVGNVDPLRVDRIPAEVLGEEELASCEGAVLLAPEAGLVRASLKLGEQPLGERRGNTVPHTLLMISNKKVPRTTVSLVINSVCDSACEVCDSVCRTAYPPRKPRTRPAFT